MGAIDVGSRKKARGALVSVTGVRACIHASLVVDAGHQVKNTEQRTECLNSEI